ncbi:serine hydrolase [Flavitalea sp.]|nr:serine hydrolase [Flavitalea sp.]
MRKTFRGTFLPIALIAFNIISLVPATLLAQHSLPDSVIKKLQQVVDNFSKTSNSPGLSIAIVHEHDVVYKQATGYTDLENKVETKVDSKFPIMSITKTFTATMFMQLVERGVIGLTDDVKKYIPEYKVKSPYKGTGPTTLLQLATHTSGLPRNTPADTAFTFSFERWMITGGAVPVKAFATNKEVLHTLQFMQLDYPPYDFIHQNDRHYSNLGYTLLGIAIERAAKTNYSDYVTDYILAPLKMKESGFLSDRGIGPQLAKGYRFDKNRKKFDEIPFFDVNAAIYPGGIYSTATDMTKYIMAQFDNDQLLRPDTRAMMRHLKIAWKPAYPYVLHEGGFPGHRSILVFNPESKIGWVILTNNGDNDFGKINEQFASILSDAFKKSGKTDLQQYTGTYSLPGGYGAMDIYLKNDSLYSTYCQYLLPVTAMKADGPNRFKVEVKEGYNINYEFVADKDGKIKGLRLGQFLWDKE